MKCAAIRSRRAGSSISWKSFRPDTRSIRIAPCAREKPSMRGTGTAVSCSAPSTRASRSSEYCALMPKPSPRSQRRNSAAARSVGTRDVDRPRLAHGRLARAVRDAAAGDLLDPAAQRVGAGPDEAHRL